MAAQGPLKTDWSAEGAANVVSKGAGAITGIFTGLFSGLAAGAKKMFSGVATAIISGPIGGTFYDRLWNGLAADEIWEIHRLPLAKQSERRAEILATKQPRTFLQGLGDFVTCWVGGVAGAAAGAYNAAGGLGTMTTGAIRGAQIGWNHGFGAVTSKKLFQTLERSGIEADSQVLGGQRPIDHSLKTDWTAQGALNALNKGAGVIFGAVTGFFAGVGAGVTKTVVGGLTAAAIGPLMGLWDKCINGFSAAEIWDLHRLPATERLQKRREILATKNRSWPEKIADFFTGLVVGPVTGALAGVYSAVAGIATIVTGIPRGAQLGWKYGASEVYNPLPVGKGKLFNTLVNPGTEAENIFFGPEGRNTNAARAAAQAVNANAEVRPAANSVAGEAPAVVANAAAADAPAQPVANVAARAEAQRQPGQQPHRGNRQDAAENAAQNVQARYAQPEQRVGNVHQNRNYAGEQRRAPNAQQLMRPAKPPQRNMQHTEAPELLSGNRNNSNRRAPQRDIPAQTRYNASQQYRQRESDADSIVNRSRDRTNSSAGGGGSFHDTRNRSDSSVSSQPSSPRYYPSSPTTAALAAARKDSTSDSTYSETHMDSKYASDRKSSVDLDDYSRRTASASRDYRAAALSDASDDNRSRYKSPITHQHNATNKSSKSLRAIAPNSASTTSNNPDSSSKKGRGFKPRGSSASDDD